MTTIERTITVDAPVERVWEYVDDPAHLPEMLAEPFVRKLNEREADTFLANLKDRGGDVAQGRSAAGGATRLSGGR